LPVVELLTSAFVTVAGDAVGLPCRYSAAAPATCGEAIDVPLMVFVAVLLVYHAEVIEAARREDVEALPKLEYDARASVLVVAPTVIALAARAGE
jgi:hypothetical protein